MKILLTGANGFVGARIRAAAPVICAPSLRNAEKEDIERLVDTVQPDAIIHTAAISDIGACERDPEGAHHANVLIPEYLAKAANGAKLVMFSSDQVYNGLKGPKPFTEAYAEEDFEFANLYAEEKLEMEYRVLKIDPNAVMLRATWMYDMPMFGVPNRGNLITMFLNAAITKKPLMLSKNEYRGITYVREVAEQTLQAINLPGGAYNFGSEADVSMYALAELFMEKTGIKLNLQEKFGDEKLWMDCTKLRNAGGGFETTSEGLVTCIEDYNLSLLGK